MLRPAVPVNKGVGSSIQNMNVPSVNRPGLGGAGRPKQHYARTFLAFLVAFILGTLASGPAAHATFVGDFVFCDVNADGIYDQAAGDYGLNDVAVHIVCKTADDSTCVDMVTLTGGLDPSAAGALLYLDLFCGPILTWHPNGDLSGRYLIDISGACFNVGLHPWTCTVSLDPSTLPPECAAPVVPVAGGLPVDGNQDGDWCDAEDGPFPEGQGLGNLGPNSVCQDYPDGPPGTLSYTVTLHPPYVDECALYADFGVSPELCGNGRIDAGEECDDGPANSDTTPDACRTDCTLASCGDGVVDTGEACDDGPANSDTTPDACRTTCVVPYCGDGVPDSGEECDNGPANSDITPDACRTDCSAASCGDGVTDPANGEECDDGPANSDTTPDACRTSCKLPSCEDGVTDLAHGEECDDGNDVAGDGCTGCNLDNT
ncbi:MAG: hypothetical protein D6815_06795, partial [Candidatus Dadabacteria bacterium]